MHIAAKKLSLHSINNIHLFKVPRDALSFYLFHCLKDMIFSQIDERPDTSDIIKTKE